MTKSFDQHINKSCRRLKHLFRQPIRVYCFHKVGEKYQPQYGGIGDWMETRQFQQLVTKLKKKYTFISLAEAQYRLQHDLFRLKQYAVLTCDDGYQCVLDILPWLEEEKVPITLFLSVGYLDGVSYDPWFDEHWKNLSDMSKTDLLRNMYIQTRHLTMPSLLSENVTLALHGFGHDEVSVLSSDGFESYVDRCVSVLKDHPRYQPFYAYTWGRHSKINDEVLRQKGLVPVCCDGRNNDRFDGEIHRYLLDEKELKG